MDHLDGTRFSSLPNTALAVSPRSSPKPRCHKLFVNRSAGLGGLVLQDAVRAGRGGQRGNQVEHQAGPTGRGERGNPGSQLGTEDDRLG